MGTYEYFYPGTVNSLDSNYGSFKEYNGVFTGYRMNAGMIGAPTSIQTANQIDEVSKLLNQGIKTVELQAIQPEVFDQIPKQQFKEINRLIQLTGVTPTMHAPMIEPSGFTKEGWSELDREQSERQLISVIDKAHELNPKGNIPVTIHASGIPGTEWFAGKKGEERWQEKQIIAINQETGQMIPVKREERFYPDEVAEQFPLSNGNLERANISKEDLEKIKVGVKTPTEELNVVNSSEWHNNLTQILFYKNRGDEILQQYGVAFEPIFKKNEEARAQGKEIHLNKEEKAVVSQAYNTQEYYKNAQMVLNSLYSKAYKFGSDEERKKLVVFANQFENDLKKGGLSNTSQALQELIEGMAQINPKIYVPVEEFAIKKAAETLGKTAFHGYERFKENAPIVSIENLYQGMAFSRSKDLKGLVVEAQKKFVEEAVKKGKSKSDAESMAKKLIGVTWDVGHLNILRKGGFETEDIVKETEAIAKHVKHVHLTDNFGYSDSHLSPGMGNVPIKEILEKLEKSGYKGKGIVEAGGFVQHFKTSPHPYVLEAFGSPIYPMMQAPYWNQAIGTGGNYFATPSAYFPEQHFSLYGGGFSALPSELGGQIAGKQSRVTGTPMD